MPFDLSWGEIFVVLLVALLVFGALPRVPSSNEE
ncbi:MAG: twin-arginine translocase TatA/TatE family subunit [Planctomycetota bacterium]